MAMTTWSHSHTTLERELACLSAWVSLLYLCPCLSANTKYVSLLLTPFISSGNLAICRQIQTFTLVTDPLTYILLHIPALLCSLSRHYGPWISLPLQQGSSFPLKLTITDHSAWLHYKAMHVKSSHGLWPSHSISKYNPNPPESPSFSLT